jgi:uncharacterized membrane protein
MPKDFDTSKIGFTHGETSSVDTNGITYDIDGNTITGSYDGTLLANNGLTVRIELPEGYFDVINTKLFIDCGIIATFIVLVFIVFVLWLKNGRDRKVVETVEFYPPDNMNSLELAFAYKENASGKDVTSLLIYLANKGYLRIEENNKSIFSYNSFKIIKEKEYDGNNDAERVFFNGLFKSGDVVTTSDLTDSFYKTQNKILRSINTKANKAKIVDKKSSKNKTIVSIIEFIVVIIMFLVVCFAGSMEESSLIVLPFVLVSFFLFKNANSMFSNKNVSGIFSGAIEIFIAIQFFIVPQFVLFENYLELKSYDWITLGVGVITLVILAFFSRIITSRTKYGTQVLGKIRGFKRFLENARKDELERLVIENPTYFYDILPYTYVLGISNKWIKKFESINIKSPDWYDSPNTFSVTSFGSSVNRAFINTNTAMSSSPSSSSGSSGGGGGSSGGGSSGHGSGGGGGGSW